jgi:hypothetical protein
MQDFSKLAALRPYTAKQIMSFKLSAADFEQLDVRVTVAGTRVAVFYKSSGEDLSTALTVDEGDQLYCETARSLPAEKCTRHRPYQRGRSRVWDGMSPCRCAAVFLNHLLVCLAEARSNENTVREQQARRKAAELTQAADHLRGLVRGMRAELNASEERWPGVIQESLFTKQAS